MNPVRVSILTFGCRANQYESDVMRTVLSPRYALVSEGADVVLVNGCTVTRLAERKARQAVRRSRRANPGAVVVLVGCIAQAVRERLTRFDEADLIAGNAWKSRIDDVVTEALAGTRGRLPEAAPIGLDTERSAGPSGRIRAFLRVQDGCNQACAYCRPTQVRGPSRSKSIRAAVEEAVELVDAGFPEIVLTGINLAQYAPPDGQLRDLLKEILGTAGPRRLRLASINPAGLTDDLLDTFRDDRRLCRHFHVPLQSGADEVLGEMRRGYTTSTYRERIERIVASLPDATFGTDLIVGFPGETEAAFQATCNLVTQVGFSNLHVFRFSPRPGTAAAELPNPVPEAIKRQRADRLVEIWKPVRAGLLDSRIATTQDVLVEECIDGKWQGYTADYIFVSFSSDRVLNIGEERCVRILGTHEDRLEGEDRDRDHTG